MYNLTFTYVRNNTFICKYLVRIKNTLPRKKKEKQFEIGYPKVNMLPQREKARRIPMDQLMCLPENVGMFSKGKR
jgi:hypothetical protein